MPQPVRIGVVGCGSVMSGPYMGEAERLRWRGLAEVVAACDAVAAKRVTAMTGTAIPERVVDGELMRVESEDNAHVLIDFGESVFAVVTTGFTIQQYRTPGIEIYGSTGVIQMVGED